MAKILTADKVRKLPVGTDIYYVREATGQAAKLWIVKSGRKKMLHGVIAGDREIKERPGWHYELREDSK